MAKEPVVIPFPDQHVPTPPPRHVIFSIGGQRYKIEAKTRITPLPSRLAEVIRIDRKSGR